VDDAVEIKWSGTGFGVIAKHFVAGLSISMKSLRIAVSRSQALHSLRSAIRYWPMYVLNSVHIPRRFIFITADADLLFKKAIDCVRKHEVINFILFRS
jgi:hypothetical protein